MQLSSARRHQLMHAPHRQAARAACTSTICPAEQSAHACTTPPSISEGSVSKMICADEQCTKANSSCMHHVAKQREQRVQVPYVQQSNPLMHAPHRQATARAVCTSIVRAAEQSPHACTTPPSNSKSSVYRYRMCSRAISSCMHHAAKHQREQRAKDDMCS